MQKLMRQRPQSGRPAPYKLSLQARYDIPKELRIEQYKLPKHQKQRKDVNFSPQIEVPMAFKAEVSSIGNGSDAAAPSDKNFQFVGHNRVGSEDVTIQALGDQINLTNVSEIQPEQSLKQAAEVDKNVSQDERQTLASEATANTQINTNNMNYQPADNLTPFGPDGKLKKSSLRGSIDSRNLIPIAEITKSPKSFNQIKATGGSNLSTANIKSQLTRGGIQQRRLQTAHPARARNMRNASAILAQNRPNSYSRIKNLHGAASAAH